MVGMDEISPAGLTSMWEIREGDLQTWTLDPARYRLQCDDLAGLAGGDPAANAEGIERLLAGDCNTAIRCAALLNAGAALYVSGNGWSLSESMDRARTSLDSGAGAQALARFRAAAPGRKSHSGS
jgi:anthranilate phosphoribosyltransferase